jgi:hypothetical protein
MTADPEPQQYIDCHVHLAALPDGENGCRISPKLLKSPLFRFLLWKHKLPVSDPHRANARYVADLLAEVRASRHVNRAVLLGMDGVYDTQGRLDESRTHFLIGNDYVLRTARGHPSEFLAGVSINPQRRDAVDEAHRCADAGAVLVKILPNTQRFDPADRVFKPFYRALAARRLPLLSHVGFEFSLIGSDQSAGDPARLRTALDEGVTVIAAHGCSHGLGVYERFLPTFRYLVSAYPQFYADISALTLVNRFAMLLRLRKEPHLQRRLLFGTDYPLPVLHMPAWGRVGMTALREIMGTRNRFDRQVLVCRRLGLRFGSFEQLLALHT